MAKEIPQSHIRNFSIIAHIDHGKSTLADRIIQQCGAVSDRQMSAQVMDTMDIEKERGITIKAQSVRLNYTKDGEEYILNLIDTPGHVDFSYEVSRSLASSDGALLIVDAAQGVEAQTIANVYIAMENDLELLPVVNKIDLPAADPDRVLGELEEAIGIDATEHNLVSAKTGLGVPELIDAIVERVPAPQGDENAPCKALIYDSWFDNYLGALALVRVFDGSIKKGEMMRVMGTKQDHQVLDLMYPNPIAPIKTKEIRTGEIGIVVMGLKTVDAIKVGDTITNAKNPTTEPVAGFEPAKAFVFAGIYPIETDKFEDLRDALNKLKLNDSSLSFEPESSMALGSGFRTGFLGMLHMEVVKERLEREFDLDLIATAPTVVYRVKKTDGTEVEIQNPSELPEPQKIDTIYEPYVKATILTPQEFVGNLITLLTNRRGIQIKMDYLNETRVLMEYDIPMNEIVMDFYDKLKSTTKGYASFDYEPIGFRPGNLVKLDIRVAGEIVDSLSIIVPEEKARSRGLAFVNQLKELIPRQLFEVAIQASIGNNVIARSNVKSMGKNVTAKCYGGDITRKRKLLEKQKAGKKRMKSIGKVEVPQEAFMAVLKLDS
ncbi:translation elongation factor 4 [Sulfurovum sp.]|uniref:translation elongation factor 4 n=1 Tax=Sulfurovum sp. TaxID=1969726 RepID=UPI002A36ABA0|nr:translation elongation factor 4 [Sulfurovum sp.]MDD2451146.1 translation elongation factor 4 [Sulfurovum sp.]MDY0401802.1 translation elongation factor 4 [Sulfurovum sp.]